MQQYGLSKKRKALIKIAIIAEAILLGLGLPIFVFVAAITAKIPKNDFWIAMGICAFFAMLGFLMVYCVYRWVLNPVSKHFSLCLYDDRVKVTLLKWIYYDISFENIDILYQRKDKLFGIESVNQRLVFPNQYWENQEDLILKLEAAMRPYLNKVEIRSQISNVQYVFPCVFVLQVIPFLWGLFGRDFHTSFGAAIFSILLGLLYGIWVYSSKFLRREALFKFIVAVAWLGLLSEAMALCFRFKYVITNSIHHGYRLF